MFVLVVLEVPYYLFNLSLSVMGQKSTTCQIQTNSTSFLNKQTSMSSAKKLQNPVSFLGQNKAERLQKEKEVSE